MDVSFGRLKPVTLGVCRLTFRVFSVARSMSRSMLHRMTRGIVKSQWYNRSNSGIRECEEKNKLIGRVEVVADIENIV